MDAIGNGHTPRELNEAVVLQSSRRTGPAGTIRRRAIAASCKLSDKERKSTFPGTTKPSTRAPSCDGDAAAMEAETVATTAAASATAAGTAFSVLPADAAGRDLPAVAAGRTAASRLARRGTGAGAAAEGGSAATAAMPRTGRVRGADGERRPAAGTVVANAAGVGEV